MVIENSNAREEFTFKAVERLINLERPIKINLEGHIYLYHIILRESANCDARDVL